MFGLKKKKQKEEEKEQAKQEDLTASASAVSSSSVTEPATEKPSENKGEGTEKAPLNQEAEKPPADNSSSDEATDNNSSENKGEGTEKAPLNQEAEKPPANNSPSGEAGDENTQNEEESPIKKVMPLIGVDMDYIEKEVEKKSPYRSVIKIVDSLINQAYSSRASDIHLDPAEHSFLVRFRVDGVLHNVFSFPKEIHSEILTRIKVLSGLRTDEHNAAQDGRMRVSVGTEDFVDVRVSIAPTYYGENCVMRLLINRADDFTLKDLGWSDHNLDIINRAIKKPYGLLLATGPTGSGKTTTLYMILKELNQPEVSIITIEDPIEYSLEGVDQIQVNAKTGLTFATGLRSILRQDPNIVMVGEIRDGETANIAVNAAMTGHLVLSTLHTNDAPTTLPRLLDLGVEPFLIASTLNIAIGQRLVRMICEDCKVKRTLSDSEIEALKSSFSEKLIGDNKVFYKGEGCARCGGTGYRSRIGIHEVIEVNEKLRELIMRRANADEIRNVAIEDGMITMTEDGFLKALEGKTTLEEVLRVFRE